MVQFRIYMIGNVHLAAGDQEDPARMLLVRIFSTYQ